MKTDILHTLQAVLLENTTSYQSDFEFDVTTLLEAAKEPKIEDRTYYLPPLRNMVLKRAGCFSERLCCL